MNSHLLARFQKSELDLGLTNQLKRAALALFCSTLVWLLTGCATKGIKVDTNERQSLNYIRYVINQTAPRGVRTASQNQREVFSNYFDLYDFDEDATTYKERAYGHFLILGASRPYKVEVRVVTEKKKDGEYKRTGIDKKRTKQLAKRLEEGLAKSREDTNFVDDWRPF